MVREEAGREGKKIVSEKETKTQQVCTSTISNEGGLVMLNYCSPSLKPTASSHLTRYSEHCLCSGTWLHKLCSHDSWSQSRSKILKILTKYNRDLQVFLVQL